MREAVREAEETPVLPSPIPPSPPTLEEDYPAPEPLPSPADMMAMVAPVIPKPETIRPPVSGHPRIAIVIDDMGLNATGSERAVRLPSFVTLAFIPYAPRLQSQADRAIEAGHEVLLHLPMEPVGRESPGPGALLVGLAPDELRTRLQKALDSFTGFDGVNNHMGSRFTTDQAAMEQVADALRERRLFFLDSRTTLSSLGEKVARERGLLAASRDVFLDDDMSAAAVRVQLAQTERIARRKGFVIAIGHPHPATLAALEAWIPEMERLGFEFVPLRALVR